MLPINKKGQVTSFLPQLVLVILAFVLIAMVLGRFMTDVNDVAAEELCRDSIAMRAASVLQVGDNVEISLTPNLCKTIDVKVEGDREEIKKQFADKMARCWWMFNEGRYDDVLDANEVSKWLGWEDYENKCFICYSMMVNEEEIEGGSISQIEMNDYILENQYYKINGTYVDYIQSYGGPGAYMIIGDILPEQAYAITFLAKSTDDNSWSAADWAALGVWVGGGLLAIGAVACIIAAPCAAAVGTVIAATTAAGTAATAAGATTAAVGTATLTGTAVVAGTAGVISEGYIALHLLNDAVDVIYSEERGVSIISVSPLEGAQNADCVITDIAGE